MKKVHGVLIAITAAAILFTPAVGAAQTDEPAGSARISPLPPAVPEPLWTPPSPPGPSGWCSQHPQDCRARGPGDPLVRTPRQHCVDRMGNGDGYASMWEFQAFEPACR